MATPFVYHAQAQSIFKPPLIANENAFLGDLASRSVFPLISLPRVPRSIIVPYTRINQYNSDQNAPEKPISCGFFRLEKGTPLVYEYTYDEMKIILEGEVTISDETGQSVQAMCFISPRDQRLPL